MKGRTVVVGAGIAGITAAYFESLNGREVILLESGSSPGGLLKSDSVMDHYFDYGTHIYSQTNVQELDQFLFSNLDHNNCIISRKITTANYCFGRMNNKNSYVDTSNLPKQEFNQGCMDLLSIAEQSESENLQHYITSRIGTTFFDRILKDVVIKFMGLEADKLSPKAGLIFDFNRVLAFDEIVTGRLTKNSLYDASLGHHVRRDGVKKYYPKEGGIGKVVEFLMGKLCNSGVQFRPSTKILRVLEKQGKVNKIVTENKSISTDKLIWTLPAGVLIQLTGGNQRTKLPDFRKTGLYDYIFDQPLDSDAVYINVYDTNLLSGRITLYQNLTQSNTFSCTVEVLTDNDYDLHSASDRVLQELVEMRLIDSKGNCKYKQFREIKNGFPLLTTDFVENQKQLQQYCDKYFHNVVFVGRNANLFFMTEILIDTYEKITKSQN